MSSKAEKGGGGFAGIKLLLCENPLPPLDEAIEAAGAELPRSNYYTEAHSAPLRRQVARMLEVPERHIHINAGSELILRQIFDRFGQQSSPSHANICVVSRDRPALDGNTAGTRAGLRLRSR
jgi:histidinol-phosphate aminotransferase